MTWALGTVIWLPIAVVLVAGLVVAGVLFARWSRAHPTDFDSGPAKWLARGLYVVAAVVIGGTAIGMYPYSAEYHKWQPASGEVASVDSRLIGASGGGAETKFVVRFKNSTQQYGCDDTRCSSVHEGDNLSLSCKRAWQYTGTDGYDCRFVSLD